MKNFYYLWIVRQIKLILKFGTIILLGLRPTSIIGRIIGPKVIVNSIPKCGTNLVIEMLHHFPLIRGKVTKTLITELGDVTLAKKIKEIRKGQCVPAHMAYSPLIDEILSQNNIKMIFVVRDFREAILSHIRYIENIDVSHRFYKLFKNAESLDEKLDICLNGVPDFHAAWPVLIEDYKNWSKSKNVLLIRFEDIMGYGEGDPNKEIEKIGEFLGITNINTNKIIKEMINVNGVTYNIPQPDKWKKVFNKNQIKKLNLSLEKGLNYFGYKL